jgi:hypothetical protein
VINIKDDCRVVAQLAEKPQAGDSQLGDFQSGHILRSCRPSCKMHVIVVRFQPELECVDALVKFPSVRFNGNPFNRS